VYWHLTQYNILSKEKGFLIRGKGVRLNALNYLPFLICIFEVLWFFFFFFFFFFFTTYYYPVSLLMNASAALVVAVALVAADPSAETGGRPLS
jgi:hypothetical protein